MHGPPATISLTFCCDGSIWERILVIFGLWAPVVVALAEQIGARRWRGDIMVTLLGIGLFVVARLCALLVWLLDQPRPDTNGVCGRGPGMPSAGVHYVASYAGATLALELLFNLRMPWSRALFAGTLVLTSMWAHLELRYHSADQVLAGALLGLAAGVLLAILLWAARRRLGGWCSGWNRTVCWRWPMTHLRQQNVVYTQSARGREDAVEDAATATAAAAAGDPAEVDREAAREVLEDFYPGSTAAWPPSPLSPDRAYDERTGDSSGPAGEPERLTIGENLWYVIFFSLIGAVLFTDF